MDTTIEYISGDEARARQSEILALLKAGHDEVLERERCNLFSFDDQILAEEYSRLEFLIHGPE